MDEMKFLHGLDANLPSSRDDNNLYHTIDTHRTFIGEDELQNKIISEYSGTSELYGEDLLITSADTVTEAFAKVEAAILNNEEITEESLITLKNACGLNINGEYEAYSSSTIISAATNLNEADKMLSNEIHLIEGFLPNVVTDVQVNEESVVEDGTAYIDLTSKQDVVLSDYEGAAELYGEDLLIESGDTVTEAFEKVEASILNDEKVINKSFNAVKTSCGLDEHAQYVPNEASTIISGASSLYEADEMLSNRLETIDISKKQDKIISDYEPSTESGEDLIITNEDTVSEAFGKLETALLNDEETTSQILHAIDESCGLDDNSQYIANSASTIISGATTLYEADTILANNIASMQMTIANAVTDVQVDGESVVENGVADIDLNSKQDKVLSGYSGPAELYGEDLLIESGDTVTEAFEKVEASIIHDEEIISTTFRTIDDACGLDENSKYVADTASTIISGATSFSSADSLLANKLQDIEETTSKAVIDVQVDGSSIVTDGVADIDLSSKQDKIISDYTPSTAYGTDLLLTNTDTVSEAFGKVETAILNNEKVTSKTLETFNDASGFDENGEYTPKSTSTILSATTSLTDGLNALDNAVTSIDLDSKQDKVISDFTPSTESGTDLVIENTDTVSEAFGKVETRLETLEEGGSAKYTITVSDDGTLEIFKNGVNAITVDDDGTLTIG